MTGVAGPVQGSGVVAEVRRREYADIGPGIFFNAASWGLLPASAAAEAADLTLRRNRARGFEEEELGRIQRRCRTAISRLLDVDASEIALAPNTSFGVNVAAALVAAGPPGTIVVSEGEFPANVLPWKALENRGFVVDVVPTDASGLPREEDLLRRIERPGVRALSVSAVQFSSGLRHDLDRLGEACHRLGVIFCVDAIQAVGATTLHPRVAHVDVLACGGQKWLCSPWGSGFVYVRKELWDSFPPPMVSWLAISGAGRFENLLDYRLDWHPTARRFELATLGIQDYLALARSVEIFLEMGTDEVERHIQSVLEPLLRWVDARRDVTAVTPSDPAKRAGIFSFSLPSLERTAEALREEGVIFSVREGAIRFSPHFYNTREEMDEVVRVMDRTG